MTHRASVNLHFNVDDIGHDYKHGSFATLDIIAASGEVETYLHFADAAMIDKAIAELVALRNEMEPYAAAKTAAPERETAASVAR